MPNTSRTATIVESVRITNVAGFLHADGLEVDCPGIGELKVDIAYGGNFYAIVEPQANYRDMADFTRRRHPARCRPILRKRC